MVLLRFKKLLKNGALRHDKSKFFVKRDELLEQHA